ncbi:MAG: molybdenum cofactor guanylyltransferase [Chloroflexota bacterium]|nr:molybdenum cofactor guanylyltransferase [Chloroflexota bacterium]
MSATGDGAVLTAAVLAGGQSRRMGTDKALLPLVPGGPPLLRLVLDRVAAVTDDVLVVASGRPGYDAFGVPVVPDRFPDGGTLGGIATAIGAAGGAHVLVVACDMPFLSAALLRWMAGRPRDYDVLVPRLPGESRQGSGFVYQTLHAIYGMHCLAPIERRLVRGQRQVIGFFEEVRVQSFGLEEVRRFDPDLRSFFNANTPEAAAEARRLLTEGEEASGSTAGSAS